MELISIKSPHEIQCMRRAGRVTAQARALAGSMVRPGITTLEIDHAVRRFIESHGGKPSFLGYAGYPGSACISVNDEVIHGIPSKKTVLREGDIVSLDAGVIYKGYHSDAARTVAVGKVSDEAQKLIDVTRACFFEGLKYAKAGNHLNDICSAIAAYAESRGYGVVRDLVGHGIGTHLHEDPEVPNYRMNRRGIKLRPGMTLAIEPMINIGTWEVEWMDDDWTVVTADGELSAHYENTVLITDGEPEVFTLNDSL